MKRLTLLLTVIVAVVVMVLLESHPLASDDSGPIPSATAVVTVKDFKFTPTFEITENAVGIEIDQKGNILVRILFTGEIKKVTPEGRTSAFAELPVVNPVPEPPVCPLRPDPPQLRKSGPRL